MSVYDPPLQWHPGPLSGFSNGGWTHETLRETVNSDSLFTDNLLRISRIRSKSTRTSCKPSTDNRTMLRRCHPSCRRTTHSWRRHGARTKGAFFVLRVWSTNSRRLLHIMWRHCSWISRLWITRTVLQQRCVRTMLDDRSCR